MGFAKKKLRANASAKGLAEYARHVVTVMESQQRRYFEIRNSVPYGSEDRQWAQDRMWLTYPYLMELRTIADHLERLAAK